MERRRVRSVERFPRRLQLQVHTLYLHFASSPANVTCDANALAILTLYNYDGFSPSLYLNLDTGVNRRDAEREVFPWLILWYSESSIGNHLTEDGLRREAFDRLDEVLVRVAIASENVPEVGDHLETVELVESVQNDKEEFRV